MIKTLSLQFFILVITLLFIVIGYSAYQKSEINLNEYSSLSLKASIYQRGRRQAIDGGNVTSFKKYDGWLQRLEKYYEDNKITVAECHDLFYEESKRSLSIELDGYKYAKTHD